jgi:ribosomal protein L29
LKSPKTKAEHEENLREVRRKIYLEKRVQKALGNLQQTVSSFDRVKNQIRPTMRQVSNARRN